MKANDRISTLLGLTQVQLAMLLGTTRSRISLYELNLRPLPKGAAVQLSKILLVAEKGAVQSKNPSSSEEKEQSKNFFSKKLQENDFQQQRLEKKISALKVKQTKGLKGQALLDQLASEHAKENPLFMFMPAESTTAKYVKKLGQPQMALYEIELQVLQYEALLLKKAME